MNAPSDIPGFFTVETVEECASTNLSLKERAASLPEGAVLIARRQTAGRGRMGRSFYSPQGTGLYLSLLLRPSLPLSEVPLITPAAAVAVCRALWELFGVQARIKWVNDVFVDGRKVCGILTESAVTPGGGVDFAVLGVGINIAPPPGGFPEEIAKTAGAVLPKALPGQREALSAAFLREFYKLYVRLPGGGLAEEYRKLCFLLGQEILVLSPKGSYPALAVDVDDTCALIVRRPGGELERLDSGEVSVRRRPS